MEKAYLTNVNHWFRHHHKILLDYNQTFIFLMPIQQTVRTNYSKFSLVDFYKTSFTLSWNMYVGSPLVKDKYIIMEDMHRLKIPSCTHFSLTPPPWLRRILPTKHPSLTDSSLWQTFIIKSRSLSFPGRDLNHQFLTTPSLHWSFFSDHSNPLSSLRTTKISKLFVPLSLCGFQ